MKTNKISAKPIFTERQIEIISHWAETPSAQEVADRMNLSKNTINVQLNRMRVKLKAKKTVEVLLFLQQNGFKRYG
jgi:DNA-binding CsgD family transcriptional regulator